MFYLELFQALHDRRVRYLLIGGLAVNLHGIVYVPGFVAHRTINVGDEPLVYVGIYPAKAGHDYGAIAKRNFNEVVIRVDGKPEAMKREDYMMMIAGEREEA